MMLSEDVVITVISLAVQNPCCSKSTGSKPSHSMVREYCYSKPHFVRQGYARSKAHLKLHNLLHKVMVS